MSHGQDLIYAGINPYFSSVSVPIVPTAIARIFEEKWFSTGVDTPGHKC
jgi:hypothetical protein